MTTYNNSSTSRSICCTCSGFKNDKTNKIHAATKINGASDEMYLNSGCSNNDNCRNKVRPAAVVTV
eukprot:4994025-Prorocentrum_lima.AAC.1